MQCMLQAQASHAFLVATKAASWSRFSLVQKGTYMHRCQRQRMLLQCFFGPAHAML